VSATPKSKLVCRLMTDRDIDDAVRLLSRGFPERDPTFWIKGLRRMSARSMPEGYPRFGYVLDNGGDLVGIALLIVAASDDGAVRANVSSWYVEPAFRPYANMLLSPALRMARLTLFNISPSPGTIETIEAQGFARYVSGSFHAVAALSPVTRGAIAREVTANDETTPAQLRLLASYGCHCFVVSFNGEEFPFAFRRTRAFGGRLPNAQLVYCKSVDDFIRFAGPLGRKLLLRGVMFVTIDANGPLVGLVGRFFADRRPKYYRGDGGPPRLGDLAETELVLFGP